MTRARTDDLADAKAALRRRVLDARRRLRPGDLGSAARALRDVLLATPEVSRARVVAAYVSVGREPGTGPLLDALLERGTEVLLPVMLPDGDLDWAVHEGDAALTEASRGLLEPTGPPLGAGAVVGAAAVLVPGLAADRRGVRLGRGGGSYDRALARLGGRAFTCVLLHDGEVLDLPVPRDRHDVPVHAAATPSGLVRLR
ncbi:MAG TPA: 5-formyltetrahydrofolate cyclo-ligase [Euzebyales bacterium]|nr:5-formyltetrahydrofolate cyclo-ligase [Euzebyales bacterium]